MAETNKVKYGLKNVHYAVITETEGTLTYGTPVAIEGAVNLNLPKKGDKTEFYADDYEYFSDDNFVGYDGSLEVALLPESFETEVLGRTKTATGEIVENVNDKTKRIALLFEFDGDAKATRHVLYNVTVGRPDLSSSTRTNTKTPVTDTITVTAAVGNNGNVKAKATKGDTSYDTWYTKVYEPAASEE
jgi:phi13 family phage major tail protein